MRTCEDFHVGQLVRNCWGEMYDDHMQIVAILPHGTWVTETQMIIGSRLLCRSGQSTYAVSPSHCEPLNAPRCICDTCGETETHAHVSAYALGKLESIQRAKDNANV